MLLKWSHFSEILNVKFFLMLNTLNFNSNSKMKEKKKGMEIFAGAPQNLIKFVGAIFEKIEIL